MKNILASTLFLLTIAHAAFAGYNDIKPGETAQAAPTAVEWSYTNDVALAAATCDDVLSIYVESEVAARGLLEKVKGAYATDPFVLCQVGAISQWVMGPEPCWLRFWAPSPAAGRKVWVQALLSTAEASSDAYVKMVCLDQLRWCGCPCPKVLDRIRAIGEKGDKSVKDFAAVVLRELTGQSIGL